MEDLAQSSIQFRRLEVTAESDEGVPYTKAFQGVWLVEPDGYQVGVALTAGGSIAVYGETGPYFEVFDDIDDAEFKAGLDDHSALQARLALAALTGDRTPIVEELDI
ncbi:MAG: hypothetical protein IT301_01550 [Dehalococcoidia bacterium]|nr:hypothetical protein [Dehalococcoidia bacterium]